MPARRRRVLISSEILEEIQEILLMLRESGDPYSQIWIDAPRSVVAELPAEIVDDPRIVLRPYTVPTHPTVKNKLRGLATFFFLMLRHRPHLLFSGFSMMKHRATSWLLRVPHFAYIRGVTFDPESHLGFSDAVRTGRLAKLVPDRVVATYHADQVFTVGAINRDFIIGRGMPGSQVHIVGPVWLSQVTPKPRASADPRTVFVTGAWAAHNLPEEHDAQTAMLASVAAAWNGSSDLVIRVHPRDAYPYASDEQFRGVTLDTQLPGDFLASLGPDDVLVAPLSTLAFEALHIGAKVAFYADETATRSYNHVYEWLGIIPTTGDDLIKHDLHPTTLTEVAVFSPIDLEPIRQALASVN